MDKRENLVSEIRKYKGIIFDLDGTLVDLAVDWDNLKIELSRFCSENLNLEITFSPLDVKLLEIKKSYGQEYYEKLLRIISKYELANEKNYLPNRILLDFINNSQQRIAVYSMNTQFAVDFTVNKYFTRQPDVIISKDNCLESKPSAKDLEKISALWNLDKNDIIYIGNAENDRISGEMANIKTLIIDLKDYHE